MLDMETTHAKLAQELEVNVDELSWKSTLPDNLHMHACMHNYVICDALYDCSTRCESEPQTGIVWEIGCVMAHWFYYDDDVTGRLFLLLQDPAGSFSAAASPRHAHALQQHCYAAHQSMHICAKESPGQLGCAALQLC